ncbi:amino acid ABC transporter permease [Stackebrandtia soli]|uniref:amino acid ABC transporter permease n=1 Tax=Stackebrandtia soli TaxID=1892856 RepID=UPI0039E9EAE8
MTSTVTEPGPRIPPGLSPRRRAKRARAIQYTALTVIAVVIVSMANWKLIADAFFRVDLAWEMIPELFTVGLANTLIYTVTGYALGFVLGLGLAIMRLSTVRVNRVIASTYIELFRGMPALLVFLLLAFGVPVAFPGFVMPFDTYGTVALGLGLVSAAYLAETFRAGIQAVPKGQVEAARSLGMSHAQATRTIVLPQAVRIVIPPLTNELILLFKDSSLVYVIGVSSATRELAKYGSDMSTLHGNPTPLVVAGLTYLLITIPLSFVVRRLERKQGEAR